MNSFLSLDLALREWTNGDGRITNPPIKSFTGGSTSASPPPDMGEMLNAHNILHSGSYYLVAGRVVHREDILRYDDKKGVLRDVHTWADTPPKAKVEG